MITTTDAYLLLYYEYCCFTQLIFLPASENGCVHFSIVEF